MEVCVSFRRAGQKDFDKALECAQRQPGYRGGDAEGCHEVAFTQDQLPAYDELIALVGRWAQTHIRLNGHPVERVRLEHMLGCYRARLAAPDRQAYCAGAVVHETGVGAARQLFPCRLIPISEANDQGWFQHGRLTREGIFVVDKGQLRHSVAAALQHSLAASCPALFPAEVDAVIDRLPDRIDPRSDAHWIYREGWQNGRFTRVGVAKGRNEPAVEAPARRARAAAEAVAAGAESAGGAVAPARLAEVRYRDIGGLDEQVRVLRENLELPLRFPELFVRLGVRPHRGLLLAGPPGTGKTLLAKALATEGGAAFFAVNGPEILSKWRGESEANLRAVFDEARDQAPAVVLIDEIDAIAPDRGRVQHNHEAVLVSQLLTLLDGLRERGQVFVVATTNRPELVDAAVRRPGRLDLQLQIPLPDATARADILRIHARDMPLDPAVDLGVVAEAAGGLAGAHLEAICREAGLQCLREVVTVDADGALVVEPGSEAKLCVRPHHFERALAVISASAG